RSRGHRLRRGAVRDVDGHPDVADVDADDARKAPDPAGYPGHRLLEAVDLDEPACAREELGGVAFAHAAAVTQDDDAIAQRLGLVELVRADQHRLPAPAQPADVAPER